MKCRKVGTQSVVAIKEFKIEDYDADAEVLRACSLREVQILRELHHPNVVTYLEVTNAMSCLTYDITMFTPLANHCGVICSSSHSILFAYIV